MMRRLIWTMLAAAACTPPPAPAPRPPTQPKPTEQADARAPTRRELEARLTKIEAKLWADPRSVELGRQRLELSVALALLEREPAGVRPPSADALLARARERLREIEQEREEVRTRILEEESARRELEAARTEQDKKAARERLDELARDLEKAEQTKQKGKPGGADRGGALGEGEPPPPPPAEESAGGVRAARVLPSAQGSSAEVSKLVEQHADRLASCVPPTSRSSGLRCEVRVRVDERGRFREPRVLASDLDPRVGSCIADVFRGMRLDGAEGDSRVVTVPLWLPPTP